MLHFHSTPARRRSAGKENRALGPAGPSPRRREPQAREALVSASESIRREAAASRYRMAVSVYLFGLADLAASAAFSYFFWKRSTRPAVSTSFCLPVK